MKCSEQIRNVDYEIYPDKKQDHLGKHKAMHRASGKPDATLWIAEFQAYPTVQQQDEQRQQTVAKLIEKFESHQYKEQFLKDMSQTNVLTAIPLRSPATFQKDNYDFNSIPGYIIRKNTSRGPKHGQSERQIMFNKAKDMRRKAKGKNHPTILSRWKADEEYRN